MKQTIIAFLLLVGSTQNAFAQNDLIERVSTLEDRIQKLEGLFAELQKQTIPLGAIAAFSDLKCPGGWGKFSAAEGRFIVGMAPSLPLGQFGGAAAHRLTVEEMPSHDHGPFFAGDGAKAGMNNGYAYHAAGFVRMQSAGGGRPHNNMPPYISLLWCIKK